MPAPPVRDIQSFVASLAAARPGSLVNPYAFEDPALDRPRGAAIRAANLRAYLTVRIGRTDLILLVGEAPGYQGARFSGLAFTSERSLPAAARSSRRPEAWQEPSATIVHGSLAVLGLEERTVLWNAVPFHPAAGTPLSNRAPTRAELAIGRPYLTAIIEMLRPAVIAAVGRSAASVLPAGTPILRHPAHGGARLFRAGLARLATDLDWSPVVGESQIELYRAIERSDDPSLGNITSSKTGEQDRTYPIRKPSGEV